MFLIRLKKTGRVECLKKKRKKGKRKRKRLLVKGWKSNKSDSQLGGNGGALLIIDNIFLFISYSFLVVWY